MPVPVRVLIADDNPFMRDSLRAVLDGERDLHVVGQAANGKEALSLCDALNPQVVIMDCAMPVMDGLQATRQIRERHPDIRVIMLTAEGDPRLVRQAFDVGVADFLLKDMPVERLTAAILKQASIQ